MKRGVFLVIEGTDGSGKETQAKLLIKRLQNEGHRVETIGFPQYGQKSAGLVEEYLSGKYGSASEVTPYQASIFYAADRFDASKKIRSWLEQGICVLADRYVGANMAHQGSKISDETKRMKYYEWNQHLEYELFGIPKPDANFVLRVPAEIVIRIVKERGNKGNLEKDIHEEDASHLQAAEQAYIDLTKKFDTYRLIECFENDHYLTREHIHERIWEQVAPLVHP